MATGELRPDDAEMVVLSVLAEGPLYGYAISKRVSARSGAELRLTPGVLYPLLARLEKEGILTASWETVKSDRAAEEESAGRRRKWYRLSAKGKKRLAQHVEAHRAYRSMMAAFVREGPA